MCYGVDGRITQKRKGKKEMKLFALPSFWKATAEEKRAVCNGCGPKRFFLGELVPDEWFDVCFTGPCDIHDWGYKYREPFCIESKQVEDRALRNNLVRVIDYEMGECPPKHKHWWQFRVKRKRQQWLMKRRMLYKIAEAYYFFVDRFGGPAYWADKNKPEEMGEV